MCDCSVCRHRHTKRSKEKWVSFSKAAAQPGSHKIKRQQHSSSGTTESVLQALAFVPIVTVYDVCVVGALQQEIEQRYHQTQIVGPPASNTKHTAVAKQVVHTISLEFPFFDLRHPRGYQINPTPRENLVQLYNTGLRIRYRPINRQVYFLGYAKSKRFKESCPAASATQQKG